MGLGRVTGLLVAALLCASSAGARPPLVMGVHQYDCKILARTQEFPNLGIGGAPEMNAWGQVAFLATPSSRIYQQIRVGHGELDGQGRPLTWRVADSDPAIGNVAPFSVPVIEDNGLVVFSGYDSSIQQPVPALEAQGIFRIPYFQLLRGDGSPVVKNYGWDLTSPFLGDFSDVSTNSAGTLLFDFADQTLYVGLAPVAGSGTGINGFSGEQIHPGARAFYAFLSSLPPSSVGIYTDGALLDSADTNSFDFEALSVNGDAVPVVSFVRTDFSGAPTRWTLEVESSLGHQVYVDSAIDPVGSDPPAATSINAWGEVVFSGVLVTNGSELWQVHCQNLPHILPISPSTSARAINNEGQIAFLGGDSQTGATLFVRADPLPGETQRPTSCTGLPDGTPCDDGYPPAIASCQAGTCVGESTGLPTSCTGLPDYTACDGSSSKTPAYCVQQQCIGRAVPEPGGLSAAIASVAAVAFIARRRRGEHPQDRKGPA